MAGSHPGLRPNIFRRLAQLRRSVPQLPAAWHQVNALLRQLATRVSAAADCGHSGISTGRGARNASAVERAAFIRGTGASTRHTGWPCPRGQPQPRPGLGLPSLHRLPEPAGPALTGSAGITDLLDDVWYSV